jgi:hypothetical protein
MSYDALCLLRKCVHLLCYVLLGSQRLHPQDILGNLLLLKARLGPVGPAGEPLDPPRKVEVVG